MRLDQMEPAVAKQIQVTPAGNLVGPVRGTGGYYIALARETRVAGSGDTAGTGSVTVKQILWSLPSNAAESEVNRAISQANTLAGKIENCNQMSADRQRGGPRRLSRARQRAGRRPAGAGADHRDQPADRCAVAAGAHQSGRRALHDLRPARRRRGQPVAHLDRRPARPAAAGDAGARLSQRPAPRRGDRHPDVRA